MANCLLRASVFILGAQAVRVDEDGVEKAEQASLQDPVPKACSDDSAGLSQVAGTTYECAAVVSECNGVFAATVQKYCPKTCEKCPPPPAAWNDPVKSINVTSAPTPMFWTITSCDEITPAVFGPDPEGRQLIDPNNVHGAATADGGVINVGIGGAKKPYGPNDAFAAKYTADGTLSWGWKSNMAGHDLGNAVCVLPSGDIIIAGVAETPDKTWNRALWKLNSSGHQVWSTTSFGDTPTSNGGFEMCEVGKDFLILSGFIGKSNRVEWAFKSGGNVDCFAEDGCKANIIKIPLTALSGTAPPTISTPALTTPGVIQVEMVPGPAKAARELANGDIAVLLATSEGGTINYAMLNADLSTKWIKQNTDGMEGTDLAVSLDQQNIVIPGHGKGTAENRGAAFPGTGEGVLGQYQGFLSAFKVADGSKVFTKTYGAGGNPFLIYNECWGINALQDGYILACGTGIEGCTQSLKNDDLKNNGGLYDKCMKGEGDPRPGAMIRKSGVWQSMMIKTDLNGNLVWQRVDNLVNEAGTGPSDGSSAAEYSVSTPAGIFVQTDLAVGFGAIFLKY